MTKSEFGIWLAMFLAMTVVALTFAATDWFDKRDA
jgi:hypothetical protein